MFFQYHIEGKKKIKKNTLFDSIKRRYQTECYVVMVCDNGEYKSNT